MKKDIITAMEKCISQYSCKGCEYYDYYPKCICDLLKDALDFMKKQNEDMEILSRNSDTAFQDGLNEAQALYAEQVKAEIKSEAIKEFAERLKEQSDSHFDYSELVFEISEEKIDNIVKEIAGDNNA